MEYTLKATNKDVEASIKALARANALDEELSVNDDIGAIVTTIFDRLNSFSFITDGELVQQLADYDDAYLGDGAKVGDLIWFDGECCCRMECVKSWVEQDQPQQDTYYSWEQYGDFALYELVLSEFIGANN